jgi:SAM-dependent MidA family methyltransferase
MAGSHDYLTEIHPQAEAFVRTLADRLERGAAFFIDYGFPEPSTTTRSATWAR